MPYSGLDTPEARAYRLLQRTITFCAVLILTIVALVFLYAADKSQGRCSDLQDIRSYVLQSTNRAIKSLPTIAYYKEHPEEQARALGNLQSQRQEFSAPLDCSLF